MSTEYRGVVRLLITALVAWSMAGTTCGQHFQNWKQYTSRNGLPQNSINDLEVDSLGYLWITTEGGLVRHDGRSFVQHTLPASDGPISLRMRQITETSGRELIVDDARGNRYFIQGHQVAPRVMAEGPLVKLVGRVPSLALNLRLADPVTAFPGWAEWIKDPIQMVAFNALDWLVLGDSSVLIYADTVLVGRIGTSGKFKHLVHLGEHAYLLDSNGVPRRIDLQDSTIREVQFTGDIPPVSKDTAGVRVFRRGREHILLLSGRRLFQMRSDADGTTIRSRELHLEFPAGSRLRDIVYLEAEELIVVGTNTQGLFLYKPRAIHMLSCPTIGDQMVNGFYTQLEMDDGRILTTGYNQYGILVGEDGCEQGQPPLIEVGIGSVIRDEQNRIIHLSHRRIRRYDPRDGTDVALSDAPTPMCSFLLEGDTILVGNRSHIGRIHQDKLEWTWNINGSDERSRPIVFRRDHHGMLWYGSCLGLFRATDRTLHEFVAEPFFQGRCVRSIEPVGDRLFIGTYGEGAFILQDGKVTPLPLDPEKVLSEVHSFMVDGRNNLWMSTNNGLVRTSMSDINAFLETGDRPYFTIYTEWSGMKTSEFNGGCEPAWIRLKNGSVSYPSMDGLVQFNPEVMSDPFPRSSILIERILVNDDPWSVWEDLTFRPDVETISFEFSIPYWGDGRNARCEYRIRGILDDWSLLPVEDLTVRVIQPSPGAYTLEVRKVGARIRADQGSISKGFTVEAPFHQRWYGILLILLASVGLFLAAMKVYNRRLTKRTRWLETSVTEQTEALLAVNANLRDTMRHQEKLISIFSHDVVPPLRFVSRVARSAENMSQAPKEGDDLHGTLADLTSSTEKLYENAARMLSWIRSRNSKPAAKPRPISIHGLVDDAFDRIREMTDRAGIVLENNTDPEDILTTEPDLLGIMVNNILLNSKLHAAAKNIQVRGSYVDDAYELVLQDDGNGMSKEVLARIRVELTGRSQIEDQVRRGPAAGLGYVIIAEGIHDLAGTITIESSASGTVVVIRLPVSRSAN